MVQPNQLMDVSLKAAQRTVRRTQETLRDFPNAQIVRDVVSTAHVIITAEERLRQRVRAALRVAVATVFLGISGLISLGANVSMAFAKKVSPEARSGQTQKVKKAKSHHKTVYLRHRGLSEKHGHSQLRGVASWYGKQFNHRRTASGVRFNTQAMMAAHRTLPFGTKVRVTNLANKRSCVVEITDRGPYAHGRVIDLSFAAAAKLGMDRTGTANVDIEVLSGAEMLPDIANGSEDDSLATPMPLFDATSASNTHSSSPVILVSAEIERR
jgi:rare lipoprotein A